MKSCYLIFFLILQSLFTLAYAGPQQQQPQMQPQPIVCTQDYALCTSAPCIPDPRNPDYAICSCVVESGDSAGYKSCEDRMPQQDQFKTKLIVSTFSFSQFNTKKSMTCTQGNPWTDCVDAPCVVDPMNSDKAICSCKILHDQEFFTFGGTCDMNTCATGFWSGSTVAAGIPLRNALFSKLKITVNPWPDNSACPVPGEKNK